MADLLWRIGDGTLDLSGAGIIMGVLNVTPDSFSDGGEFLDCKRAVEHGLQMVSDGARIIDIGGESTRPGSERVAVEAELERVLPVIRAMRARTTTLLSIDTSKAAVARAALDEGATIINDVTGGRHDPRMMRLAKERGSGFVIMHMQGEPRTMQNAPDYGDVVAEVREFFRQQYTCALDCGIDPMCIAFDPGIGFGKTLKHNLELLRHLRELRVADRPLVVGVSRKAFLGKLIASPVMADRLAPTVALTALLRERGANILRVHDVKPNFAALRAAEAILETET